MPGDEGCDLVTGDEMAHSSGGGGGSASFNPTGMAFWVDCQKLQ